MWLRRLWTETKLLSTYNSTEFGVPTTGSPPKYSWLGADGVASELTSTGVITQSGSSYVPELGRPLQTGSIASPGSFPNGAASVGVIEAPYLGASNGQLVSIAIQESAEREEAKKLEAEEKAKMTDVLLVRVMLTDRVKVTVNRDSVLREEGVEGCLK